MASATDRIPPAADAPPALPSQASAWYAVAVMSLAAIVSFIDRQVINLLVDPIKLSLGLTDVQISLLQGFSFALFYTALALPLAWLADRTNRKAIILLGLVFWSGATFASGLATVFAALFVARMFIGVGEATLSPAGTSIISDYFSREKLPTAMSVFTGSSFVGSGLALIVGGFVYQQFAAMGEIVLPFGTFEPWQATFLAVSTLSIPPFLLLLAMREPPRRDEGPGRLAPDEKPHATEALSYIWQRRGIFIPLYIAFSCFAAAQYGIGSWAPTYFIRVHGWTQMEVGQYFGPLVMVCGTAGVMIGGYLAERMMRAGYADATVRLSAGAVLVALPLAGLFPLIGAPFVSLGVLALVVLFGTMPFGAGVATFPLITPNRMRGQVIAFYLLIANMIGYSGGPLLVAWLSDNIFTQPSGIAASLATGAPIAMAIGLVLIVPVLPVYRRYLSQTPQT